jgi:hypothetical protein
MPSVERGEPGRSLAYHVDVEVLSHTYMYSEMESVAVHFSLHRLVEFYIPFGRRLPSTRSLPIARHI